jgi:hypothetical protein
VLQGGKPLQNRHYAVKRRLYLFVVSVKMAIGSLIGERMALTWPRSW